MRFALFVAVVACACKGEPFRPDAQTDGPPVDEYDPPWFYPKPNEVRNWDIQLAAPYDFAAQRQMYVVELWDVVPATTLDYGDGAPVSVPAGSQMGKVAELKGRGMTVLCHVGTGSIRLTDPDAMKFPGFKANPPDRPNAPEAGSVIGWSTTTTNANERWLDIRAGSRPLFEKFIMKRIELAKMITCDGVVAKGNDGVEFQETLDHGFPHYLPEVEIAWISALSKKSHDLLIGFGGRGAHAIPDLPALRDDYDFVMVERCTEIPDCDRMRTFTDVDRAVFGLDYDVNSNGNPTTKAFICQEWGRNSVDGVIKQATLDSAYRETCF